MVESSPSQVTEESAVRHHVIRTQSSSPADIPAAHCMSRDSHSRKEAVCLPDPAFDMRPSLTGFKAGLHWSLQLPAAVHPQMQHTYNKRCNVEANMLHV